MQGTPGKGSPLPFIVSLTIPPHCHPNPLVHLSPHLCLARAAVPVRSRKCRSHYGGHCHGSQRGRQALVPLPSLSPSPHPIDTINPCTEGVTLGLIFESLGETFKWGSYFWIFDALWCLGLGLYFPCCFMFWLPDLQALRRPLGCWWSPRSAPRIYCSSAMGIAGSILERVGLYPSATWAGGREDGGA